MTKREEDREVLSAILLDPEIANDVEWSYRCEDPRDRYVLKAMWRLHQQQTPIDCITIREMLKDMENLHRDGLDDEYLLELANLVPSVDSYRVRDTLARWLRERPKGGSGSLREAAIQAAKRKKA
jgi:replicative DNA helicase